MESNDWYSKNLGYFSAVENMRAALIYLSTDGENIVRVQIKNGNAVIELEQAPTKKPEYKQAEAIELGGVNYQFFETCNCQIVWRI